MATIENLYVGDGSTVLYSFTFPYIEEDDIKVSLDDVITTEYSLANATTVEFVAAPATGVAIRIYRDTSVDDPKAVFYPGSAIRAQDLNDNFEQSLFVIQEADFNNTQSATDSAAALATAQAADTKADQANVQSAAAEASAAQAQTDATQAASDAATAQADATQAAADASSAQISADQANVAVQSAAVFVPVANVAAIPSSPADQDRVSVLNSTGIASFTPLTGLPVGPTYNSGAYVNLIYQTTGASWYFVAYGPNDPDSRYLLDTNNSIKTFNITNNAVTTAKIVNAAVTVDKLGTNSVTTAKIADGAITTDKLGDNSINVFKINNGAINTAKIVNGSVTPPKLDRSYVATTGGTMTGALYVPAGASGTQAPQVQEVVKKTGDTMTGDLKFTNDSIILDASTGDATFTGYTKSSGHQYTNIAGTYYNQWSNVSGGQLLQYVDNTPFNVCYSRTSNITWTWNVFSEVIATIDGVVSVVCGSGSDYRLKENVELSTYGTDAVKALRPVSYDFKATGAHGIGFIAHEAAEVIPGAATGEKDGEMMQSINTYPIVATLTKALQESIERIEALEAKVQTLENS